MPSTISALTLVALLAALTLYLGASVLLRRSLPGGRYLRLTWLFLLALVVAAELSLAAALWFLAVVCFWALREYFSLVELRLQDRLGLLGGYLSIPFMITFIQQQWYGMFIVSIPVYAFLAIPLLVTLGGRERRGTVVSVAIINFGLFLCVYCLGHIGYLMLYSPWMAAMLIIDVATCDAAFWVLREKPFRAGLNLLARFLLPLPFTIALNLLLGPWTEIPPTHGIALAALIPALAIVGRHTIDCVQIDLGIRDATTRTHHARTIDRLESLFYAAPVVFHYIRYYLK
ncbi:MAG: hypothetical protein AB1486_30270 [Planctomycetota bacterium]